MIKQSKQNTITNENISPFNKINSKPTDIIRKQKLFKVLNISHTNKEKTNYKAIPLKESTLNGEIKPKPLFKEKTCHPPISYHDLIKEEHVLDFDKLLETLYPKAMKEPFCISNEKLSNKKNTYLKRKTAKSSINKYKKIKSNKDIENRRKRRSDLYNLNNFFSDTLKIVEKKESIHIECPAFKNNNIFTDDNYQEEASIKINELDSEIEDISDQHYKQDHDQFEQMEHEYRIKLYKDSNRKKRENNTICTYTDSFFSI